VARVRGHAATRILAETLEKIAVGKDCFSEIIDHGDGKLTLFGRVLADMPEDPARQNTRSALIPVPSDTALGNFVVNASFVTADPDDPHRNKPFFPFRSTHDPERQGIRVEANRRRDDANPSQYVCEYIVVMTTRG
jgi:hypothetical protein